MKHISNSNENGYEQPWLSIFYDVDIDMSSTSIDWLNPLNM